MIDYDRMRRVSRGQKSALTRAIRAGQPDRVRAVCAAAVKEWDEIGAWPDDWSRWQRALDDVFPLWQSPRLEDLRAPSCTAARSGNAERAAGGDQEHEIGAPRDLIH